MLFSCKCLNLVIRLQKPNDTTTAGRQNFLAKLPNNVGMEFFKQVKLILRIFVLRFERMFQFMSVG